MKGKCPNCNTDLRYVKSINQWLCNDCGFTVEGELITVEQRPQIQPPQKGLNSLELYLLSFASSIIITAIFFAATRAAYPLQTFVALLVLIPCLYWFYWELLRRELAREYIDRQTPKNPTYSYNNGTSSINSSLSKPSLPSSSSNSSKIPDSKSFVTMPPLPNSSSNSSSSKLSNSKSFVTILNSGEINISSQTIPEAKIAIKELKLKKKEYTLEKKGVIQKQKEIRAKYRDKTLRRPSKARGRSFLAVMLRESETKSRDNARRDLANALQPLDQQKNSIETKIGLIDQAILHLEKFIAGLQ